MKPGNVSMLYFISCVTLCLSEVMDYITIVVNKKENYKALPIVSNKISKTLLYIYCKKYELKLNQ